MSTEAAPVHEPSPREFRALFESCPGNHLILAPDLRMVAASESYLRAAQKTREELIGRYMFDVFPDHIGDQEASTAGNLRASVERVLRDRAADRMAIQRYDMPGADGALEECYWQTTNIPVFDDNGAVAWIIHNTENVTEAVRGVRSLETETAARLSAEAALRQAQKMEAIGQLTGGIAHDFNNLLTVVGGSIDLIRGNTKDETRVLRLADNAMTAIERCERLIKQLLMFSRRQVLRPETVNLNRLIADFAELIGRVTLPSGELLTELSPVLHPVNVDTAQFESALLNLVVNAREAMADRGRILIETQNVELDADYAQKNLGIGAGAYVVISVSDSGTGIPPELIDRVFDPFVTTKEVGKGSGLGLSQVYGFAKESGGQAKIYSEVGIGTTVKLYLPRAAAERTIVGEPEGNDHLPLRRTRRGETVLIVEDDRPVLDMAVESLKELGYKVLTAEDALQALAILKDDTAIDILFSDVVMPGGMNGVQLAVEARRLRPQLKILLTSGYTAAALSAQHGLEAGLPLLEKPYRPQELAMRFRVITAGR